MTVFLSNLNQMDIKQKSVSNARNRITFHLHRENYISISFHIELDIIVVTVFLSILNQMDFHLVQNRKENYHHDHIPFNVKGNRNIVFSVRIWLALSELQRLFRSALLLHCFILLASRRSQSVCQHQLLQFS